jgi:ADP-ribose pyrophosphatase YjhB (NUDIX family)
MRQRIRVSALVVRDGGLLLVRHVVDDREWWCPPGGGVEGDEPLPFAAERELHEETGVTANALRIIYLLDFIVPDPPCRNLEVYILMGDASGEPRISENESRYLKEARFFTRDEMAALTVYPAALRDTFWDDLSAGVTEARYLGLKTIEM